MKCFNWSHYPVIDTDVITPTFESLFSELQVNSSYIARGLGRCYGDASLSDLVLSACNFDKCIDFDIEKGIFRCQAGVSLKDILTIIVPKGWFLPVVPGTKYITLGGAIASDIHGKKFHLFGFGMKTFSTGETILRAVSSHGI